MSERPNQADENPLQSIADKLSQGLSNQPVEMNEEQTNQVAGGQVFMRSSVARTVQASALHMEESAAGMVRTGSLDARDSVLGPVVARDAMLNDVTTPVVAAASVRAQQVRTFMLIGGKVEGAVTTVLTPLTALLSGAGFALTLLGLAQLVKRLRK